MIAEGLMIKKTVYQMVEDWLDSKPEGFVFKPWEIQDYIMRATAGKRRPHDATITRYIRLYNERGGAIKCISRARSSYKKLSTSIDASLFAMQEAARDRIGVES